MSLTCSDRIILTDVDDTILSFSEAFQRWAREQGHAITQCIHEAGTVEGALGLSIPDAHEIIMEFLISDAFGKIEPEPCALEILPQLHRDGYRFVAITACDPNPLTVALRERNLRDAFGFAFEDVIAVGFTGGEGKGPSLRRYQPTIWVEDNFNHAVLGADIGHNSLLINRSANHGMSDSRLRRVGNWHEIATLL